MFIILVILILLALFVFMGSNGKVDIAGDVVPWIFIGLGLLFVFWVLTFSHG